MPNTPKPVFKIRERDIQRGILDYLAARRILAYRMNTGAHVVPAEGGRKRRHVAFGLKGMADIMAFPFNPLKQSVPLWIESKTQEGRLSAEQKSFAEQVREYGHRYFVARDVQEVWIYLHEQQLTGL